MMAALARHDFGGHTGSVPRRHAVSRRGLHESFDALAGPVGAARVYHRAVAGKLFHAVVVGGAMLGAACSGRGVVERTEGDGGGGGHDGAGGEGGAAGGFDPRGCGGAPLCEDSSQLFCDDESCCYCDDGAPGAPEECAGGTHEFQCMGFEPEPTGCWCDENAPASAAECSPSQYFNCYSYEPPVGCVCTTTVTQ